MPEHDDYLSRIVERGGAAAEPVNAVTPVPLAGETSLDDPFADSETTDDVPRFAPPPEPRYVEWPPSDRPVEPLAPPRPSRAQSPAPSRVDEPIVVRASATREHEPEPVAERVSSRLTALPARPPRTNPIPESTYDGAERGARDQRPEPADAEIAEAAARRAVNAAERAEKAAARADERPERAEAVGSVPRLSPPLAPRPIAVRQSRELWRDDPEAMDFALETETSSDGRRELWGDSRREVASDPRRALAPAEGRDRHAPVPRTDRPVTPTPALVGGKDAEPQVPSVPTALAPRPLPPRASEPAPPRISIGRVRVEVLAPSPPTPTTRKAPPANLVHAAEPPRSSPARSQLRFGLGQL